MTGSTANFTAHFLIAMPNMVDPHFAHTLTYVCEHNDDGALGIVVNKPIDMTLSTLFEQIEIKLAASALRDAHVHFGGPVSTVTMYRFNSHTGALDPQQIVSTLPDSFTGNSRASEIAIGSSGRFLYASNRGYDSIAVFEIIRTSGRLQLLDVVPSLGRTPRFFTLTPNGEAMFVLNEDSDSIVMFEVSVETGRLQNGAHAARCGSPVCMVFSADDQSRAVSRLRSQARPGAPIKRSRRARSCCASVQLQAA